MGFVRRNHPPLFLTMMRRFLLARLVNSGPLGDALVVATPRDNGALGEIENTLNGFPASLLVQPCLDNWCMCFSHYSPNLDVASPVILGPDAEDIFATPDAEDETAHFICGLNELIAN